MLRGGIWKPRTRPNGFEGIGLKGLKWLKEAGDLVDMPVITEVANANHVEEVLKAGIDAIWVGARTTANPFSVQEIAEALRGEDVIVLVKNPINPDVKLWVGALERLSEVGIQKLGAVHRGFSALQESVFRNLPMWEIPIALKRICPRLEVLCDPSHIAGNKEMLPLISQKALDLNMDGLMIESHPDPDRALSDPEQQVLPERLDQMLDHLTIRKESVTNQDFNNKLEELRNLIDDIDTDILNKIAHRMSIVDKIGEYKKENEVTILQLERWKEILDTRGNHAKGLSLEPEFVKTLLDLIHKLSIQRQTEIMNEGIKKEGAN